MKQEQITLRCEYGQEAVVFTKYTFKTLAPNPYEGCEDIIKKDIDYEICIEDDYVGGEYKGFFGRIKRAWRAFWDKPVVYAGIYCEDERKMRQFLTDCLNLIDENDIEETKTMYQQMKGNAIIYNPVTSMEKGKLYKIKDDELKRALYGLQAIRLLRLSKTAK